MKKWFEQLKEIVNEVKYLIKVAYTFNRCLKKQGFDLKDQVKIVKGVLEAVETISNSKKD